LTSIGGSVSPIGLESKSIYPEEFLEIVDPLEPYLGAPISLRFIGKTSSQISKKSFFGATGNNESVISKRITEPEQIIESIPPVPPF